MPNMTFPFITFHSARDTMVEPESSSRLYERTGPQVDKEFVKVDHMCACCGRSALGTAVGTDDVGAKRLTARALDDDPGGMT